MLRLRKNQSGQGMTEYIIIVAVIAIAAIAAFSYFGKTVRTQTAAMSDSLAGEGDKAVAESAKAASDATSAETEAAENKGLKDYTAGQVND